MARCLSVLLLASLKSTAAQIEPSQATNITVYHLNPLSAGTIPKNMDTGDALGDLYFYLDQFLLPLECAAGGPATELDCNNPERLATDLVVTAVEMEVNSHFTNYSACNLCNGTDPMDHDKPCEVGTYVCDCSHNASCDPVLVGKENISDFAIFGPTADCSAALESACGSTKGEHETCASCIEAASDALQQAGCKSFDIGGFCPASDSCLAALDSACGEVKHNDSACFACTQKHAADISAAGCGVSDPWNWCPAVGCTPEPGNEWKCWKDNIPRKTGGLWYSHPSAGLCEEGSEEGSCSWRVLNTVTVNDTCLKESLILAVESEDPGCFAGCGVDRNTSSPCWVGCFFDTIMGPAARHASNATVVKGMPLQHLVEGWTRAFLPEEQGGCPRLSTECHVPRSPRLCGAGA